MATWPDHHNFLSTCRDVGRSAHYRREDEGRGEEQGREEGKGRERVKEEGKVTGELQVRAAREAKGKGKESRLKLKEGKGNIW